MNKPKIIVICGATATGKTGAAIAVCERFHGEVVSADSMQVYRRMDIGTAKPDHLERRGIPHHMIDVTDPRADFSAALYAQGARRAVSDILGRDRLPVVCGGTGFYINALLYDMKLAGAGKTPLRARYEALLSREGPEALHARLQMVDAISAARLHQNDTRRVVRALEVYEATGAPIGEQGDTREALYDALILYLDMDKERLAARIDARVEDMMARGLLSEVRALLDEGVPEDATSMQGIGYRQLVATVRGERTLAESVELIKIATRQYAKRQRTWFRRAGAHETVDMGGAGAMERICKAIGEWRNARE